MSNGLKRCLACGLVFDSELCSRRYLSNHPHQEKFTLLVIANLFDTGFLSQPYRSEVHRAAIELAKKQYDLFKGKDVYVTHLVTIDEVAGVNMDTALRKADLPASEFGRLRRAFTVKRGAISIGPAIIA